MPEHSINSELWRAYATTRFEAETPRGTVILRVGQQNDVLDEVLKDHGAEDWAFITACNPHSKILSESENRVRNQQLLEALSDAGRSYFPGQGVGTDPSWRPEISALVLNISPDQALALGFRFGQNAVVVGSLGHTARLLACADRDA